MLALAQPYRKRSHLRRATKKGELDTLAQFLDFAAEINITFTYGIAATLLTYCIYAHTERFSIFDFELIVYELKALIVSLN